MDYRIVRTNSENNDFRSLISELDKELSIRNGDAQFCYNVYNKIDWLETVIIAYAGSVAVGCCCFKQYNDSTAEVKRMFLNPGYRGKGLAGKMLHEIEIWAKEKGFKQAILETGLKMVEAISVYKKSGYTVIPNYGQYADNADSICFSKRL